jgi:hypothetical protein
MTQRYASSGYSPSVGYTASRPSQTHAPYTGGSATPTLRASGYASPEAAERTGTAWQPGVTGALEPYCKRRRTTDRWASCLETSPATWASWCDRRWDSRPPR